MQEKQRYFVKTYYIGDNYYGSQRQDREESIEGAIITALKEKDYIKDEKESIFEAASRTDRFVSARGAVFSFISQKKFYPEELNTVLPLDIGVWSHAVVPLDYMPRRKAISRQYKYVVEHSIHWYEKNFDFNIDLIRKGCELLQGRHDFVNFAKKDKNNEKNTVKDLQTIQFSILNNYIVIDLISRSFLRQQVRRMVKKLIELGTNVISIEEFNSLLDPTKSFSYKPASAKGLILWDVQYTPEIVFTSNNKGLQRMVQFFNENYNNSHFKMQFFDLLREK